MKLKFNTNNPDKEGWYLVRLATGNLSDRDTKPYDVDFYANNFWMFHYRFNITGWAKLPEKK